MKPRAGSELLAVSGAVLIAALLRFPTLRVQSFWDDEGATVKLMRLSLGGMIRAVPSSESTPPTYYILAWLWSHIFGMDEWGLRSLSALFGVALVLVAYSSATALGSKRAGIIAAYVVAVNPLLIWYSQEARVYAMFAFVASLSFLAFLKAYADGGTRSMLLWAGSAALALCTQYFAVFLIVPSACALLSRHRQRVTLAAVGGVGAVGFALLPLALAQRKGYYNFLADPLTTRVLQVLEQPLVGYGVWYTSQGKLAAIIVATACVYGLFALRKNHSRIVLVSLAVLGVAFVLPVALAVVGLDYVLAALFLGLLVPSFVLVSLGFSVARGGSIAVLIVLVTGIAIAAAVETRPQFQREDLRGAQHAVDQDKLSKAVVVTPPSRLDTYQPSLRALTSARVEEVVLVALAEKDPGKPWIVPRTFSRHLKVPGFHLVQVIDANRFTLVRFRADRPERVSAALLLASRIRGGNITRTSVLYEPGR
jgi:mannosyltransferase